MYCMCDKSLLYFVVANNNHLFVTQSSIWARLMRNSWSLFHAGSGAAEMAWISTVNLAYLHCWLDSGE